MVVKIFRFETISFLNLKPKWLVQVILNHLNKITVKENSLVLKKPYKKSIRDIILNLVKNRKTMALKIWLSKQR